MGVKGAKLLPRITKGVGIAHPYRDRLEIMMIASAPAEYQHETEKLSS